MKIVVTIALMLFLVAGLLQFQTRDVIAAQTIITEPGIEKHIRIQKINNKAILVKLGVDAIIAIETQKGIVVIDAGISNSLTEAYRKIIEQEFTGKDFIYLINTHSHPDHTGGNQVFADAKIIGHKNCLTEMTEYWRNQDKIKKHLFDIANEYQSQLDTASIGTAERDELFCQQIRYQYAYNDLIKDHKVTFPTVTFSDSISFSLGDVTLNLIFFGNVHSGSDIIIHIPEWKLLFTGDLFFPGGRPSYGNVNNIDREQLNKSMQWLSSRSKEIEQVIGGHGQIMQKEDLDSFIANIRK